MYLVPIILRILNKNDFTWTTHTLVVMIWFFRSWKIRKYCISFHHSNKITVNVNVGFAYIALQVLVYASSIDQDNWNKNIPKKSSYVNAVPVFINKCRSDFKVNLLSIKYLNSISGKNPLLQKYFLIAKNIQSNKTKSEKITYSMETHFLKDYLSVKTKPFKCF